MTQTAQRSNENSSAAQAEIERLQQMSPSVAEYAITRNYLDYLINLPWNKVTDDTIDIEAATKLFEQRGLRRIDIHADAFYTAAEMASAGKKTGAEL